jgi:hypothetical protein
MSRSILRRVLLPTLLGVALVSAASFAAGPAPRWPASAARSRDDYRHFRVASIDLVGRMPTREEIAVFERPDFDFDRWVGEQLKGPAYVERLRRVYMDALRLEPNLNFPAGPAQLYRATVDGPDGNPVNILYRGGQRRVREATDGEFCLSPEETGLVIRPNAAPIGEAKRLSKKLLETFTVAVKPWWLYRDYKSPQPHERYEVGWKAPDPGFRPVDALLKEPDGKPTMEVRVCREEAETRAIGHFYASGRKKPAAGAPPSLPGHRVKPAPGDSPYAVAHKGEPLACGTKEALTSSVDCGCGVGLEECMANGGPGDSPTFQFPNHAPLGAAFPLDSAPQTAFRWYPYWWSREAIHYVDYLFAEDRDFREILTGRATFVNGPLAQFYRNVQRGGCCGPEAAFGMREELEPLVVPANIPTDLAPQDVERWELVADRGPHAAGILTMPMFLEKYASARARGAALYNDFLCKSFNAEQAELTPSDEPDLTKRAGCRSCHATLEPLAAYFARIEPASFVYLPESLFPVKSAACKKDKAGKLNGACNALYDVSFYDDGGATLRSAHASPAHADAAATGAARDITRMPEFAQCAVQRVTASFLGRPTTPDDAALVSSLTSTFVQSGFRMSALVRAVVESDTYLRANDDASDGSDVPPSAQAGAVR